VNPRRSKGGLCGSEFEFEEVCLPAGAYNQDIKGCAWLARPHPSTGECKDFQVAIGAAPIGQSGFAESVPERVDILPIAFG
jgi:hypothetical protein